MNWKGRTRNLTVFAFMASHDLQEPLRKIRAFSEMIAEKHKDNFDVDDQLNMDRIQKSAARLQELIKDILSFSKVSAAPISFTNVSITELLKEVIDEMHGVITEKKACINMGALPSLPVNGLLMKTVLSNLLSNAIKYAKNGTPAVIDIHGDSPEAGANDAPSKYARIYVQDNGIGFDLQYSEKIFEMFQRLHSQKTYPGTGIGLALCKRIIEKHNGFISARGKEKEGSTFIITLPVVQPAG